MKIIIPFIIVCMILAACAPMGAKGQLQPATVVRSAATPEAATPTPAAGQPTGSGKIPNFEHIVLIVLENESYETVIGGSTAMPLLNALAKQYVLLTNDYAVTHPSLPNYLALVSGSTQKVTSDCLRCFVDAPNLADLIEKSGRTWKAYEESMPSPCFIGNSDLYAQKHNPFIYFDSIRLNTTRCQHSIVPLTQLDTDLAAKQLPDFSLIVPNLCNSGHNCGLERADSWISQMVAGLQNSPALGEKSLIIITFDEGNANSTASCCGMGKRAGGRVATVLISPLAAPGFADGTQVSHYGLLKTILVAWGLPDLGNTKLSEIQPIVLPWK